MPRSKAVTTPPGNVGSAAVTSARATASAPAAQTTLGKHHQPSASQQPAAYAVDLHLICRVSPGDCLCMPACRTRISCLAPADSGAAHWQREHTTLAAEHCDRKVGTNTDDLHIRALLQSAQGPKQKQQAHPALQPVPLLLLPCSCPTDNQLQERQARHGRISMRHCCWSHTVACLHNSST